MKFAKTYTVLAMAAAMLGFCSCSDVTDPKLNEQPGNDNFTIYTPSFQNEYYGLTETGTFDLTLSGQPDYGYSAITQYRALVSLTEDFAESRVLVPVGTGTLSKMTLRDNDLAIALCALHGVETKEDYVDLGEQKVYFKGQAFIDGILDKDGNNRTVVETKNVVSLNRVQAYLALPIPGKIWVIGNYAGSWIGPDAANETALEPYALSEKDDAIGSKKYYGTIEFTTEAEGSIFRFYTALEGWDANSLGCSGGTDSDTPVEFPDFVAGSTLEHALAATKDSFKFENYCGKIEFFVDLSDSSNPKATFKAVE